jgi:hypothetical protein
MEDLNNKFKLLDDLNKSVKDEVVQYLVVTQKLDFSSFQNTKSENTLNSVDKALGEEFLLDLNTKLSEFTKDQTILPIINDFFKKFESKKNLSYYTNQVRTGFLILYNLH